MQKKVTPYGTRHSCTVVSATGNIIIVHADDGEGYVLIGHGMRPLPEINELGTITFVKSDTPFDGHWQYQKNKFNG